MRWYGTFPCTDIENSAVQAKQNHGQGFHWVCVSQCPATIIDVTKTHVNYVCT